MFLKRYVHWLHARWPAGVVEKLPRVNPDGTTNVPGLYITGDLTGIPLLKFAADSGARAVQSIVADPAFQSARGGGGASEKEILDLVIVGAGVSGMAAALEAEKSKLTYQLFEASEPFSTVVNFPKGKPIFTYPTEMRPAGDLQFTATVKEPLVDEMKAQTLARGIKPRFARVERVARKGKVFEIVIPNEESLLARRVVVAIGRSGNFRKLGVPGEDLGKVYNRLHDPKEFAGKSVLVVGGGDSALEAAIAIAQCGGNVTISYRKAEFSRPKADNIERLEALKRDPMAEVEVETPVSERVTTATGAYMGAYKRAGSITLLLGSKVNGITDTEVSVTDAEGKKKTLPNDAVFAMIGREPPLDFFRRSGVRITGETTGIEWVAISLFFLAMLMVYDWKNNGFFFHHFPALDADTFFPKNAPASISAISQSLANQVKDRKTLVSVIAYSMKGRSFYYTSAYTLCIAIFGLLRIRRRKTPYVKLQTLSLFLVQLFPLFLLPEVILPWMGYNGYFNHGFLKTAADHLFELYVSPDDWAAGNWPDWGHPRAYWRAYGFILAWPLMVYNVFTSAPISWWIAISFVQTFVIIPLLIYFYGKGVYCGWICSCGGLAETMGDTQRHKMFHGARWNRLNMVGQAILAAAFLLLGVRVLGWVMGEESLPAKSFSLLLEGKNAAGELVNPVSWKWAVDVFLGGIIGVGLYFKYSGRVWCRFACPLAALMHIYARFSRFRILSEKKKCISCNVCTSVCHQGIDIMNFANKGMPMEDPECVRCSACVQSCPTGTLSFGQVDRKTGAVIRRDPIAASLVHVREGMPH
ncbi:MAG: NAD(P)-binding domain-containing protein [Acidobacteriota bacterium]